MFFLHNFSGINNHNSLLMITQQNLRDALYYIELLSKIVLRVFDSALILYKDEKSAPRKT